MAMRDDLGGIEQTIRAVEAAYDGILPPNAPPAPTDRVAQLNASIPPATIVLELEDGNIARLPADADITNVRANGADLEFVQPDGTVIVITGGAIANLVLFIGDVQIPAEAVELMFTSNGIQPAAGPEAGEPDGTGSYVDLSEQHVGTSFRQNSLLNDTDLLQQGAPLADQVADNTIPAFPEGGIFVRLSEEGLTDGIADDDTFPDDQTNAKQVLNIGFGLVDAEGNDLSYSMLGVPAAALTSHGVAIVWELIDPQHLVGRAGSTVIIDVLFDNVADTYTVTLSGPIDHPDPTTEDTLDLVLPIRVADFQNFSDSTLTITIEDDSPIQGGQISGHVSENDLANFNFLYPAVFSFWQGSTGTSPYDNDPSDGYTGLLGTVPVWGDLSPLVAAGADGDGGFHLISEADATTWLAAQILQSNHDKLDTVQAISIAGIGDAMGFFAGDRLVFGLFVGEDGVYNFRLFDQLDHTVQGTDTLPIDLSSLVTYSDFDGDTITLSAGRFIVNVVDDVPVGVGTETATLDEDDLANFNLLYDIVGPSFWQGSLGTSPFDGLQTDQSATGLFGTVTAWGYLGDNVKGGADEFGRFSLVDEPTANAILKSFGPANPNTADDYLYSHGDKVDHVQTINILGIGEAMGFFAADGRLVMGLYVDEFGIYNVRLFDQLDHITYDENGKPVDTGDYNFDFGKFVSFTDRDGDVIDLSGHFDVKVVDDKPELRDTVATHLDEGDLSNFNPINAALLALSPAGFLALPDYLQVVGSEGNDQSPTGLLDQLLGTASQSGFLNTVLWGNVVAGGADEFGKFEMVSAADAATILTTLGPNGSPVTSNGKAINHVEILDLGVIDPSLGSIMGFFASDGRLIFSLTVTEFGAYDIRLFDQIDHGPDGSETDDSITLALGSFVTYTDFDGDSITLDSHFTVTIQDDEPLATGSRIVEIDEAELNNYNSGNALADASGLLPLLAAITPWLAVVGSEGSDPGANGLEHILGSVGSTGFLNELIGNNVVSAGADEFGTFGLLAAAAINGSQGILAGKGWSSQGEPIDHVQEFSLPPLGSVTGFFAADGRLVFTILVGEGGLYDVRLFDQIDHLDGNANVASLDLDLGDFVTYTDADGDTIDLGTGHFVLRVADDKAEIDLVLNAGVSVALSPSSIDNDPVANLTPIAFGTLAGVGGLFSTTLVNGSDEFPITLNPFDDEFDVSYALKLGNGVASGLVDPAAALGQQEIVLELNAQGTTVTGRNGAGEIVLVITIDPDTGNTSAWQYKPLEDTAGDATAELAPGALLVQGTVTDFDGSTHSDTVELGSKLSFNDSVPDITDIEDQIVAMDWPSQTVAGDIFVNYGGDGPAAGTPVKISGLPPLAPDWVAEYSNNDTEVRVYTNAAKLPGDLLYTLKVASEAADGDSDGDVDDSGYIFTLHKPWPAVSGQTVSITNFGSGGSGDYPFSTALGQVVFNGINPNGASFGVGALIDQGLAYSGDQIEHNEKFDVDFPASMSSATLAFSALTAVSVFSGAVTVTWTATGPQGSHSETVTYSSGGNKTLTIAPPVEFTNLEFSVTTSGVQGVRHIVVDSLTATSADIPADDQPLNFQFIAYDDDGDSDTHSMTIHLSTHEPPQAPAGEIWVMDADLHKLGSYNTLGDAVAAAPEGGFVILGAGTFVGNVTVTKPLSIVGAGDGSNSADSSIITGGIVVNLLADAPDGLVAFKSLAIVGASSAGIKAQDHQILGTLELEGVRIEDASSSGLLVSGRKQSTAYDQAGVQKVIITDSTFTDNAQSNTNSANIMLFEFDGDATIDNVKAANTVGGTNSAAYGIQIHGVDGPLYNQKTPVPGSSLGSYDVLTPMGVVTISDLEISGVTRKASFYVQGYTDTTGLNVTDSSVDTVSGWNKPVVIDPMADQFPNGTPNTSANVGSFFDESNADGSFNVSGLTVVQNGTQFNELEGTTQNDEIVGTNANDVIAGYGGIDFLTGGDGDDVLLGMDGNDWLDGGDGNDVLIGGEGVDTLNGGGGSDRFVLDGVTTADFIADYDFSDGDVVDISALLDDVAAGTDATAANNYVRLSASGILSVDQDGSLNGENFIAVAELTNHPTTVTITLDDDVTLDIGAF